MTGKIHIVNTEKKVEYTYLDVRLGEGDGSFGSVKVRLLIANVLFHRGKFGGI
jgi:hypothetical protein